MESLLFIVYGSNHKTDKMNPIETETRLNDFLSFLGSIQRGHKINIHNLTTISSSGFFSGFYRYMNGENKSKIIDILSQLSSHLMKKVLTDTMNKEIYEKMIQAIEGLNNLKQTYYDLDSGNNIAFCKEIESKIDDFNICKDSYARRIRI